MDTGGLIIQPLKKSKHFLKCYKNRITELPYLLKRGYCLMGFFHMVMIILQSANLFQPDMHDFRQ
jgi:hypothetical protein